MFSKIVHAPHGEEGVITGKVKAECSQSKHYVIGQEWLRKNLNLNQGKNT